MAKISMSFDTVTKDLAVELDGTKIENVVCIDVCPSWDKDDEFSCNVTTVAKDIEHDLKVVTRLIASQTPEGIKAIKAGASESKTLPGFVAIPCPAKSKATSDIERFFTKE